MRTCSALATASLLLGACGSGSTSIPDGPHLTIDVAALGEAVGDAVFALTVVDAEGATVAHEDELSAARYGAAGGFDYLVPCEPGSDYRVELVLLRLVDAFGHEIPAGTWHNPTSAAHPLVQSATCSEAGLPVSFALDLAMNAADGFFDIGVRFDDVFCSAKVDCVDDDDQPLRLLYRGDGTRGETVVFALACTAGGGPTWLYLDDLEVTCGGLATPLVVDPQQPEGNTGARSPALYETAVYHGVQIVGDQQICYWNAALGIDVGTNAASCVLHTRGTAADTQWRDSQSPADHVYPVIDVDVPLTDPLGHIQCGHHPVAADGPVAVRYTDGVSGEAFDRSRACGFETVPFPRDVECDGTLDGQGITFTDLGSGRFDVHFGSDGLAAPLSLPVGRSLASCCANPCCADGPGR
ncbi:MAG: hypothetical protein U1F43_28130 [Myxococcota bacterium]